MKALYFLSVKDAKEYLGSQPQTKSFVLFSNVEKMQELSLTANSNVVLCSTAGEYTPKGYKNGDITGFEYDNNYLETEVVEILYPPIKSMKTLKSAYSKVKSNKNAFMLLFCNGLAGMEEAIVTTFYFMDRNFKIIGGSAGDNLAFKETYIYIGNKRVQNVALFFNSKERTHLIKENIYAETGTQLLVTEATPADRTVKTFNNKPASIEYARVLGISETQLAHHFMNNPLGKVYREDIFIASPMKVNSDKSITFYCQLMPNTFVHLLKAENPINILKQTLKDTPYKPSFVFSVNCILRSLKFIEENLWKDFDKEMLGFCDNSTGFISYGEQCGTNHCNQTMVMVLIE